MGKLHLSSTEEEVLRQLAGGSTLKTHRDIDGRKVCKLHPLAGPVIELEPEAVNHLKAAGLIDSNKKFPAATYLLTEKGRRLAESLVNGPVRPLSAKNY